MAEGESDILSGDWGHISQHKQAAWLSDSQAGGKELCREWDVSVPIPQHQYPLLLMLFPDERPCLWCQH